MASIKTIVAFDFDNTLTRFNVSSQIYGIASRYKSSTGKSMTTQDAVKELLRGCQPLPDKARGSSWGESPCSVSAMFCDVQWLREIKKIQSKNTVFVVVSYGYKPVIQELLKQRGILDIFDKIYTPTDFGLSDGFDQFDSLQGKNIMLERVRADYGFFRVNAKMLLVDDNKKNIDEAVKAGYSVVFVQTAAGIDDNHINGVIKFINSV
jgi:FMN phosphatase YigB (HAD superfamily)